MAINILYSLNLLMFIAGAIIYSPEYRTRMYLFYLRMAYFGKFRKSFRLMLFAILMVQHFYFLSIFRSPYDVMVSTAMCFVLLSERTAERIFHFLQDNMNFFITSLAVCAIIAVPYCFMTGIVIATLLLGAMFYPSASILYDWNPKIGHIPIEDTDLFFQEYYRTRCVPRASSPHEEPSEKRLDNPQE